MITRREALKKAAAVTSATIVMASAPRLFAQAAAPAGPFSLPPLPYSFDALEPHIDARTMEIHHDRHHAAYIANLNKAIADDEALKKKNIEEIVRDLNAVPEKIRNVVRNNGGGHLNHSLFWQMMKKGGGGEPKGDVAKAIAKKFGSFNAFKDEFTKAAMGQFGSGWAWLSLDEKKEVRVEATPNQDSPVSAAQFQMDATLAKRYGLASTAIPGSGRGGAIPLLGLDVWEHAYYLKYQNKRADYVAAFFNVINWDFVEERYKKATA